MRELLQVALYFVCVLASTQARRRACRQRPIARHCYSPQDEERIFFNTTAGICQTFDWKTCTTGANSFSSWQDCYHACVCDLDPLPIPCGDYSEVLSMGNFYFNRLTQQCDAFPTWHQGCTANDNAFQSESACKMACVCSLPRDPGNCNGRQRRFYFSNDSGRCEEFVYKGCGGNANRFETMEQCQERCLCGLPRAPADDEAQCMAHIPSVFYNSQTGNCEPFIYGGCGGNNNRFENMAECRRACG